MLGPFTTTSRLTPIHQMSLAVLSRAACALMSTTTTTTTRDRGDRYGSMEWAQKVEMDTKGYVAVMATCVPKLTEVVVGLYIVRSRILQ